jgi:hypothetical protein
MRRLSKHYGGCLHSSRIATHRRIIFTYQFRLDHYLVLSVPESSLFNASLKYSRSVINACLFKSRTGAFFLQGTVLRTTCESSGSFRSQGLKIMDEVGLIGIPKSRRKGGQGLFWVLPNRIANSFKTNEASQRFR